jgi:hypothetical protein
MAKNTGGMKRSAIRYIRDGIKANYKYAETCEVCGCTDDLELHHPNTVSLLFDQWCLDKGYNPETKEEILEIRTEFYNEHWHELVDDVMTLCNTHHKALHKVYGSQPPLSTAPKQREWVKRIRDRSTGKESHSTNSEGFSRFIPKTFTRFSDIL